MFCLASPGIPKRSTKRMPREIVYLCEARYSENGKYFNKIKIWDNTIPEKATVTRPEMEYFKSIRIPKKVSSPLAEAQQDPGKNTRIIRNRGHNTKNIEFLDDDAQPSSASDISSTISMTVHTGGILLSANWSVYLNMLFFNLW